MPTGNHHLWWCFEWGRSGIDSKPKAIQLFYQGSGSKHKTMAKSVDARLEEAVNSNKGRGDLKNA